VNDSDERRIVGDILFDRIGAVGIGYGRVGVTPAAGGEGALLRAVWQGFAELRALIEGRILAAIPDRDIAGVAVAFVTGSQSAVPKDVLQAMRDSGLAHLLSVSGLHVGLVAGILFFLSRAMLALVPPVALRYPIKKWALAWHSPAPSSIPCSPAPACRWCAPA
jgi:competence protein ComEC